MELELTKVSVWQPAPEIKCNKDNDMWVLPISLTCTIPLPPFYFSPQTEEPTVGETDGGWAAAGDKGAIATDVPFAADAELVEFHDIVPSPPPRLSLTPT
jgi:hypothetical protein